MPDTPDLPEWRKSSYCGSSACVEVAHTDNAVLVRDSKDTTMRALRFTRSEWTAFLRGAKNDEFDLPH